LGPHARNSAGDLSDKAIEYAYDTMEREVAKALTKFNLVLAVGSFRSERRRNRFRGVGEQRGAGVIILRVACSGSIAAQRVLARLAHGEEGPDRAAIDRIESELARATDIDIVLHNESSIDEFRQRTDELMTSVLY
jgi:predicted kinase